MSSPSSAGHFPGQALVHDALLLAGLTEEEALRWLERTRVCGLESRFTLPRKSGRALPLNHWLSLEADDLDLPPW